jgi:hypothetical protein
LTQVTCTGSDSCSDVHVVSGVGPPSGSFSVVARKDVDVSWLMLQIVLPDGPGVSEHCAPQMVQLAGLQVFTFEKSVVNTPFWQETVPDEVSVQPSTVSANDAFVPS